MKVDVKHIGHDTDFFDSGRCISHRAGHFSIGGGFVELLKYIRVFLQYQILIPVFLGFFPQNDRTDTLITSVSDHTAEEIRPCFRLE